MPNQSPRESWHLDKKVPIAMIIAIAMQAAGFLWYAAKLDSRVLQVEINQRSLETWKDGTQDKLSKIFETLGRVDERIENQKAIMLDIKSAVNQIKSRKSRGL